MPKFDPWSDAQPLATQLQHPNAELLVLIGAESWCQKCQTLKPRFEALSAAATGAHVAWMWLDLEDHAEFLGGFVPPDLPLLVRWRAGTRAQVAVVENILPEGASDAAAGMGRVVLRPVTSGLDGETLDVPDLWREFTAQAWAQAGA